MDDFRTYAGKNANNGGDSKPNKTFPANALAGVITPLLKPVVPDV